MATSKTPPPTHLFLDPLRVDTSAARVTRFGKGGLTTDTTNDNVGDHPGLRNDVSSADTERQATTARTASPADALGRGTAGITP
jgi:hypothetical protein